MKRHLLTLSLASLFLMGASALAQNVNLKANVPFDFIVNGKTMPAGSYALRSLLIAGGTAVQVQNMDSRESIVVLPSRNETKTISQECKLIFHRYGANYFLRRIVTPGDSAVREIPSSRWEKELAQSQISQDIKLAASLQ